MLRNKLQELTSKSNITLTARCNDAIKIALKDAKSKGKTSVIMFTIGQWIAYDKIAEEIGLNIVKIENPDCAINIELLREHLNSESVLLLHSLSAYYYPQPIKEIYSLCQSKGALFINDCCASIGWPFLLQGDYLVCSFGRWKPLTVGKGGFLATNFEIQNENIELPEDEIVEKINQLPQRVEKLNDKCLAVIADLLLDNLHPLNNTQDFNLVVVCPFDSDEEKEKILNICEVQQVEYKECPFDIRSERQAISIEVKRLN